MSTTLDLPRIAHPDFAFPGRKPVGPVKIDWSHPLARGLCKVYLPRVSGGNIINVVNGAKENFIHTGTAKVIGGTEGEVAFIERSAGQIQLSPVGAMPAGTVFFRLAHREIAIGGGNTRSWFTHADYANNHRIYMSMYGNGGAVASRLGGSAQVQSADGFLTANTVYSDCMTWGAVTTNSKRYVNGNVASTFNRGSEVPGSTTDDTFLGYKTDGGIASSSNIFACFMWLRQLSDSEVVSISSDPYQFLIPANNPMRLVYSAGAQTFNAGWALGSNSVLGGMNP